MVIILMNCSRFAHLGMLCLLLFSSSIHAASPIPRPIQALLVTGGCCHDYARQQLILTQGISARANVIWTVVHQGGKSTNAQISLYKDPHWAEGFDVVIHNECFANVRDAKWAERILDPHRQGTPAVLIHCAMHCYRASADRWHDFVGMHSPGHGSHYAFTVENIAAADPIMATFGEAFRVPKGELYHAGALRPTARALAQANRQNDGEPQVCVWTNEYGSNKTRVFATTLSHYNETMVEPKYLDLVTRGLLWTVDQLNDSSFIATNEQTDAVIRQLLQTPTTNAVASSTSSQCCGEGNLAFGHETKATSEEIGRNNFARHAVDGDLRTRWCAAGGGKNNFWQVDLGKPESVRSLRIHWEKPDDVYRYTVEASTDGSRWNTIVDQSKNQTVGRILGHNVDSPQTRYLRVHFKGSGKRYWASFWEFEAYTTKLPPLPPTAEQNLGAAPIGSEDLQVSDGFTARLFGTPPEVNYPVCLAAAATGEVFVGVDEQGSLGKEPAGGKVLRCLDTDGDGKADKIDVFAKMDHPRGLIYDNGSLWVLHPPTLSVFHDDDLNGIADRQEILVTGLTTEELNRRGADHTTNGIRMGIDGWIYIAVGDFGFVNATGTDGRTLTKRGGGVLRVRPDGTEMEVYAWGLRNILDVSIDPQLNLFTRDNTNDGGGWDIRVTHVMQSAEYGYPSWYLNFADEIMPPLAQYGGGSGCGSMFLQDTRWPAPFGNAAYTCDWGTSQVFRHNFPANGATFDAHQEQFLKIPRPTDIDVDGSGRMYVSSWKNGGFSYSNPDVGFVAQIQPADFVPKPFPHLTAATDAELIEYLNAPSAVYRLHSQREILRRPEFNVTELVRLATDKSATLSGRIAAVFTCKQKLGTKSHNKLSPLFSDPSLREWVLRALTDRQTQLSQVPTDLFIKALSDSNPRVRAQAAISIGRLGKTELALHLLPLALHSKSSPPHNEPNPSRVIPHLAIRALVSLAAEETCLAALATPQAESALRVLRYLPTDHVVEGIIQELRRARDVERRSRMLATLIRLYYREGSYEGDWWGTRPDTSGPFYRRTPWKKSPRIAEVIQTAIADSDPKSRTSLEQELARHKVEIPGVNRLAPVGNMPSEQAPITIPVVDPDDPNLIANMALPTAQQRALRTLGDQESGKQLFRKQACHACHTHADGQIPKGPHLVDIGKRYKRVELIESILKPNAKIAQGFDSYTFAMESGKLVTGFLVSQSAETVTIRQADGIAQILSRDEIEEQLKSPTSMMPVGLVNNLTPEELANLLAYLESLK